MIHAFLVLPGLYLAAFIELIRWLLRGTGGVV